MNYTLHSWWKKNSFLFEGIMYDEGVRCNIVPFRNSVSLHKIWEPRKKTWTLWETSVRENFIDNLCAKQIKIIELVMYEVVETFLNALLFCIGYKYTIHNSHTVFFFIDVQYNPAQLVSFNARNQKHLFDTHV